MYLVRITKSNHCRCSEWTISTGHPVLVTLLYLLQNVLYIFDIYPYKISNTRISIGNIDIIP